MDAMVHDDDLDDDVGFIGVRQLDCVESSLLQVIIDSIIGVVCFLPSTAGTATTTAILLVILVTFSVAIRSFEANLFHQQQRLFLFSTSMTTVDSISVLLLSLFSCFVCRLSRFLCLWSWPLWSLVVVRSVTIDAVVGGTTAIRSRIADGDSLNL